jgi:cell division protein FtsA
MFPSHICALDIGSSKIAATVAVVKRNQITGLFFDHVVSKGVKNGVIVDSIEFIEAVTRLLNNLRARSQVKFKTIAVNISGQDIITRHSRAIVPLAERGNKVITSSDIQNVNAQARILGSSLDEEIIHGIPSGYSIDSKSHISKPLGLYSHKLYKASVGPSIRQAMK